MDFARKIVPPDIGVLLLPLGLVVAFVTVFLPAGKHIIEYYYYPYIYIYGLIISIITLISAGIVLKKFYE